MGGCPKIVLNLVEISIEEKFEGKEVSSDNLSFKKIQILQPTMII